MVIYLISIAFLISSDNFLNDKTFLVADGKVSNAFLISSNDFRTRQVFSNKV